MSQISVRFAPAAALVLAILASTATDSSAETRRVVVRVYETGIGDLSLRTAALQTASQILERAGIAAEWHDCTNNGRRAECQDSRRAGNFIARIMPVFVAGAFGKDTVETLESLSDSEPPLGFAVVDPQTRAGKMATVFHDQIEAVARRTGVARGELLGRVLAHEVGHLLLGVHGHSRNGIMRAVWTDEELARNRPEDWLFPPADRIRLQRGAGLEF